MGHCSSHTHKVMTLHFLSCSQQKQNEISERQINGSHCSPIFLGFPFKKKLCEVSLVSWKVVWRFFVGFLKSINR